MAYILQVDFPHYGIFGQEFVDGFTELAKDIKEEEGLIWKIWTENKETKEAGGIYLFADEANANRYLKKHTARLASFGYGNIRGKIFSVSEPLSKITKASFL